MLLPSLGSLLSSYKDAMMFLRHSCLYLSGAVPAANRVKLDSSNGVTEESFIKGPCGKGVGHNGWFHPFQTHLQGEGPGWSESVVIAPVVLLVIGLHMDL